VANEPKQVVDDDAAVKELQAASENLKARIEEAKKANSMPVDSALGDPNWEKKAADGRFDKQDDEDE
jgi:hypothetical protein